MNAFEYETDDDHNAKDFSETKTVENPYTTSSQADVKNNFGPHQQSDLKPSLSGDKLLCCPFCSYTSKRSHFVHAHMRSHIFAKADTGGGYGFHFKE